MRKVSREAITVSLKAKDKNGNLVTVGKAKRRRFEQAVRATYALAGDGNLNAMKLVIELEKGAEKYQPPPEENRGKTGVLVVYPTLGEEEWEKATEGKLLTENPLAGLPGGDELYELMKTNRSRKPLDFNDPFLEEPEPPTPPKRGKDDK